MAEVGKVGQEAGRDELRGTTLKVYRYMYKAGRAVRINEIHRALGLSSPSVAQYHVRKLLQFGLIREEQDGYVVDRVVFSNIIRVRRVSIPYHVAYAVFFAASLIALLTFFRPSTIGAGYFFALLVITVGVLLSVYEGIKTLRQV
jgi:predicted DNA-binding transcriptional regulator